jgi:hypothetical protein
VRACIGCGPIQSPGMPGSYRSAKSLACFAGACRIGRFDGGAPVIAEFRKKSRMRLKGLCIARLTISRFDAHAKPPRTIAGMGVRGQRDALKSPTGTSPAGGAASQAIASILLGVIDRRS